jgi:hypothetical protein
MDGARASGLYSTVAAAVQRKKVKLRRVGGSRRWRRRLTGVNLAGAAVGADLGGSSKYSSENLED